MASFSSHDVSSIATTCHLITPAQVLSGRNGELLETSPSVPFRGRNDRGINAHKRFKTDTRT